jgi:hypothetical protein
VTHAEITAALRNDVETHCDVYRSRPRLVGRPDALQAWRGSSSRSRQLRVADGRQGGRETPAVESVVSHGDRPEESGPLPEGRSPHSFQAPRCECGCVAGDHNQVIGAGVFAAQMGRCIFCPGCSGFREAPHA